MCDNKEVVETLKAATSYLSRLKNLNNMIQSAELQITASANETEKNIETTFTNLLKTLSHVLLGRKAELIKWVQKTKLQSITPLEECRSDISRRIDKTHKLICEGQDLLSNSSNNIAEFSQKSSLLGSLPEIPELKEVPYISYLHEPTIETELIELCSKFGEVFKIAPVQISHSIEKPGAILIGWQSVENDEKCVDIQEFRLQKAFGDVINHPHLKVNYSDCYVGLETQFLIKELQVNQLYSFRVCCKFEGCSEWSPWSLPLVTSTSLKPFSWSQNKDFVFANENKIASPVIDSPSLLLSDGAQFAVGYSVEFTYLEFDKTCSTVGLLVANDDQIKTIKSDDHSYFALDSSGEIYVDGVKKATKLPEFTKGMKICFMCELIQDDKVRVNIDTCDKQVTYDWHIHKTDHLYFAALLKSCGTKIMVE